MLPTRFASLLKRFGALIVDTVIILMLIGMLEAAIGALWIPLDFFGGIARWIGLRDVFDSMIFHLPGFFRGVPHDMPVPFVLAIYGLYYAVFEAGPRQATPGKMLFGLFVTDLHGQRLSWRRGLGRGFSRLISAICFIGYIIALFSSRKQALHDIMAHTFVLEPQSPPPPSVTPPPSAQGPQ